MNNDLRWDPSVLIRGNDTTAFWKVHFSNRDRKTLFVLGKGFDVRMNIALQNLISACPDIIIKCWLIEFDEGADSNSINYRAYVDENVNELHASVDPSKIELKKISLLSNKSRGKRKRVGDRQAAALLESADQISGYSDIIVDISSLPRGVYFSLIGKFLTYIDKLFSEKPPNFMVVVSENAAVDMKIKEKGIDEDVGYLHGFGGTLELTAELEKPIVWFPILGEDKNEHLERAHSHIKPDEICPVLPFPSKNPRRSDDLIKEYHQLLFDRLNVESHNLMYVPEQNPFQAYMKIVKAIKNYDVSLAKLNGCKAVISTFSSKLLSIGTLIAAYELIGYIGVGVLNVDSQGYDIDNFDELKDLKNSSELFVIWLTGEPYE